MCVEICHLRDLVKIEKPPIYKRVVYKGLETWEMELTHVNDLNAAKKIKKALLHQELLLFNSCVLLISSMHFFEIISF